MISAWDTTISWRDQHSTLTSRPWKLEIIKPMPVLFGKMDLCPDGPSHCFDPYKNWLKIDSSCPKMKIGLLSTGLWTPRLPPYMPYISFANSCMRSWSSAWNSMHSVSVTGSLYLYLVTISLWLAGSDDRIDSAFSIDIYTHWWDRGSRSERYLWVNWLQCFFCASCSHGRQHSTASSTCLARIPVSVPITVLSCKLGA